MVADAGGLSGNNRFWTSTASWRSRFQPFLFDHALGQARVLDHERELPRAVPQSAFLRRAVFGAPDGRAEQQNPGDSVLGQ